MSAPDEPVFFLDYNFGRRKVPPVLRAAGALCEVHIDHFAQNADDVEWLPAVGQRGWFVITKDYQIGRRVNEIEALRNAGVGVFVFASTGLTGEELAAALVKSLPRLRSFITETPRPFIAKIYKDGRVEAWK